MTIRIYVDEDAMDRDLVEGLRARGIDVLTALEAGMIERSDEEHLDFATREGRILYSFNIKDFYRLHQAIRNIWQEANHTQASSLPDSNVTP